MNEFSHPDAARQAAEDPEFAEAYRDLSDVLAERKASISGLRSDPRAAARLKQAMIRWVEDDVTEEFHRAALMPRLLRRLRSLARTWRDLLGGSRAFRYASRGALALGLGLVLGVAVDLAGLRAARAASESDERAEDVIPAPSRFGLEPVPSDRQVESEVRKSRSRIPTEAMKGKGPGGASTDR